MFKTLDEITIRRVGNGYYITVHSEDHPQEMVFDTPRRAMSFIKKLLENNSRGQD
jgi:hypothetical protein